MIDLIAWRMCDGVDVPPPWGLKRFGNLLCERYIDEYRPRAVLEVGVGFNSHFHDLADPSVDYWTIDKEGFYDTDRFAQGIAARYRATHVDGLVGDFPPELPSEHFDLAFSVSALEHSDAKEAPEICEDLYRISRPGGLTVHTIDTPLHRPTFRLEPWYQSFLSAGFKFTEEPNLTSGSRVAGGLAALVEPLDVHTSYYRGTGDFWQNPHMLRDHQGTIVVVARRPHP